MSLLINPYRYAAAPGGAVSARAVRIPRARWTPNASARLNRSHPLAQGLLRWYDHADNANIERVGSGDVFEANSHPDSKRVGSPWGPAWEIAAQGGGSDYRRGTVPIPTIGSSSLTVMTTYAGFGSNPNLETSLPNVNSGATFFRMQGGSGDIPVLYYNNTVGTFMFIADGAGLGIGAQSTTSRTLGQWYHVTGTYRRSANSFRMYIDGKLEGADNYTIAGTFGGSWGSGSVSAHNGGGATGFIADKRMGFTAIWTRELSEAEVAEMYADPYQIFR